MPAPTIIKSHKQRTYLDPLHGPIVLDFNDPCDLLLAKIIDTKELQRLRRIHQMGLGSFTFHGAEHTRFGHSLGTLYIAKKMINHLSDNFPDIDEYKTEILVSALIHDIGHGPFSHTSEKLTPYSHEEWTKKIISEKSEVNNLFLAYNTNLSEKVINILEHRTSFPYLSQIISGYVDCDRLDYLYRDSYYVGVPYGLIGSDRIIASLEIDKDTKKLVVREATGLDAIIHYLHARYSMYQQVYQHKKNLACDFLLRKIIERVKEVKPKNISVSLAGWLNINEQISVSSYLQVDDFQLIASIQNWAGDQTTDKVLGDLSNRLLLRNLFKSQEIRFGTSQDKINEIIEKVKTISSQKKLNSNYYIGIEQSGITPYEPYEAKQNKINKAIFIKQQNGEIKELSSISKLVKALSQENIVKTCLVYAPELEDEINNLKGFRELLDLLRN